jgi:tRNA threonylcarbamoyladenosine biosynthesis protein TsaB
LCYASKKPLLLLNTLDVMAFALKLQSPVSHQNVFYCPLIDARRMEVFTALYDQNLHLVKNYTSEIIDNSFLEKEISESQIILGGNGSFKFQKISTGKNLLYVNPLLLSQPAIILANQAFINGDFANVAYSEPFYIKPVYFRK